MNRTIKSKDERIVTAAAGQVAPRELGSRPIGKLLYEHTVYEIEGSADRVQEYLSLETSDGESIVTLGSLPEAVFLAEAICDFANDLGGGDTD